MKNKLLIFILCTVLLAEKSVLFGQTYCIPTYASGNTYGDYIALVKLDSINNSTGKAPAPNFFSDYTYLSTTLIVGNSYAISITNGTYAVDSFAVWIDYNKDNDFSDAGELIGKFKSTAASQINSISFTIPAALGSVKTRLRVRCIYNTKVDPCNTFAYGETEDYTVYIKRPIFKSNSIITFQNAGQFSTSSNWLDYNRDDTYELFMSGYDQYYYKTANNLFVYPNQLNVSSNQIITGSGWIDMNNDGYLEALCSGYDPMSSNNMTQLSIYKNGNFIQKTPSIVAFNATKQDWKDFDNDGKYDLLINGKHANLGNVTKVYKNDGLFNFDEVVSVTSTNSSGAWIDIDNDGDFDAIIGNKIYKNINGVLSEFIQLPDSGDVAVGDFNMDGFTDFIIGNVVYINDSGSFHLSQRIDNPAGKNSFGDYDNDGDLDLLHGGVLYENKNGTFQKTEYNFFGSNPYFIDYDKDGKIDIANLNSVFINQGLQKNSPPAPPQTVSAKYENGDLVISWDSSIDDRTPSNALTYNLFLSTTPGGCDIISPNSNQADGFRYIIDEGNAGQNHSWRIKNIPLGSYYFGVQAIDNCFAGSTFKTGTIDFQRFSFTGFNTCNGYAAINQNVFFESYDANNDGKLDAVYDYFETVSGPGQFPVHLIIGGTEAGPFTGSIYNAKPIDYNQDGTVDLLILGSVTNPSFQGVINPIFYLNKALPSEISGPLACFDFDNDGREDIVNNGHIYKKLRINTTDTIIRTQALLPKTGAISYADIDLDMDYDVLIGDSLFRNDNGVYTFYQYLDNSGTCAAWGDYNNDGYPDLIAGNKVFRNDSGKLVFTGTYLSTYPGTEVFWADFNNDGYLDILFFDQNNNVIQLFENDQGNRFIAVDLPYEGCTLKTIALSDVDNDHDIDILGLGYYFARYYFQSPYVFTNQYANKNVAPSAPASLKSKMSGLNVLLSWNDATDDHTPSSSLTYNIIVGTKPWKQDIMPCYSDINTGFRKIVQMGNVQYNKSWILKNLPVGKYYWSAQAIDQAYCGGPWAPIDSFVVTTISPEFKFNSVCLGNTTDFTNLTLSTDPIASYIWDFGDKTFATESAPSHTYTYADTFKITLTAISILNDTVKISHDVIVRDTPENDFSANVACQGTVTAFLNMTNIHDLNISDWRWEFGDGLFSTAQNPDYHGYINAGDYIVKLKAIATNGCADSIRKTVSVGAYPVAVITANTHLSFCDGDSVTLSVGSNPQYSYVWMLDGTGITNAIANNYTAKLTGNYSVEVTNTRGSCTDTSSQVLVTKLDMPATPVIVPENYQEGKCPGENQIILSVDQPVTEYNYQWKRNGTPISDATGSSYSGILPAGDYIVEVSLSGCKTESAVQSIIYNDAPAKPSIYSQGPIVWYLACSIVNASHYKWYYNGNLIPGADKYLYVANQNLGNYYVSIGNAKGCYTASDVITIPTGITGIEDIDPFSGLKIYPNPTSGIFTIEMENQKFGELMILVMTQEGKQVLNHKFEKTTEHFRNQIDLSKQSKGIYFIYLQINGLTSNKKIIIE